MKNNNTAINSKKRSPSVTQSLPGENHPTRAWLTVTPYPYQLQGAIQAAWHDHTLIADEPGLGKTLQAILTAHLISANQILIITPPALITNWKNEIKKTGHTDNMPKGKGEITTITSKNKTTPTIPTTGYTITSDTLATARPTLAKQLASIPWDLIIIDESHRLKNYQAKRTRTITNIARNARKTIALTGTPIISSPLDLLPTLRILRKTHCFPHNYVGEYTVQDYWGNRVPNPDKLPDLYQRLEEHVWTRRTKKQVLTDLPEKTRHTITITPPAETIETAFTDLKTKLETAITTGRSIEQWAKEDGLTLVSQARRATGIAKIPAALEWITNHHHGTHRPLIAWCIHTTVMNQLKTELVKARLKTAVYNGATTASERDQIVQSFQDGHIDVLLAQITAAGVGLTLTRASEALFVETEWTPALVVQAEDRIHRISQSLPVTITTLLAENTLDPVIHRVLAANIKTLDAVTPGSDHHVTSTAPSARVSEVLTRYAHQILGFELGDN